MGNIPRIGVPGQISDFHDSSLLHFGYDPIRNKLDIILSTPDPQRQEKIWKLSLDGILRFELESLGDGKPPLSNVPPEIYDIYDDLGDEQVARWEVRMRTLGVDSSELHCVVLASSFLQGWGENEELEGIKVICRGITVQHASDEFKGMEYSRPWIHAKE